VSRNHFGVATAGRWGFARPEYRKKPRWGERVAGKVVCRRGTKGRVGGRDGRTEKEIKEVKEVREHRMKTG